MAKIFLLLGAFSGLISVALGAFGAHALRSILEANQRTDTFELASRYQFYHSFALLIVGLVALQVQSKWLAYSGYGFLVGMLIFSGSLYILALSNMRWLGAITPIGGVALIAGWLFLLLAVWSMK